MKHLGWIALCLLALLPFVAGSQYLANLAMLAAISAALGQSWNIAGGFGGQTSFGHAAFFGVGAYAAAILQSDLHLSPWLGLPAGAAAGAIAGAVIGFSAFRAGLRGSYFALVTLAFAEAFRVLASSLAITRGGRGFLIPLHPGFAHFQFVDRRLSYAAALALLALATATAAWLTRSRFGSRLIALRENEDAARALGVPAVTVKTATLAISAALAALGGVLYLQTYLYLDPAIAFSPARSVDMLLVAMIGGAGTVAGPILGGLALAIVDDASARFITLPGFAPMLDGVVLLAIIAFLPRGIVGAGTLRALPRAPPGGSRPLDARDKGLA